MGSFLTIYIPTDLATTIIRSGCVISAFWSIFMSLFTMRWFMNRAMLLFSFHNKMGGINTTGIFTFMMNYIFGRDSTFVHVIANSMSEVNYLFSCKTQDKLAVTPIIFCFNPLPTSIWKNFIGTSKTVFCCEDSLHSRLSGFNIIAIQNVPYCFWVAFVSFSKNIQTFARFVKIAYFDFLGRATSSAFQLYRAFYATAFSSFDIVANRNIQNCCRMAFPEITQKSQSCAFAIAFANSLFFCNCKFICSHNYKYTKSIYKFKVNLEAEID